MSRSADTLKILAPALGGTAVVLGLAVAGADRFATGVPSELRMTAIPPIEAAEAPRAAPEDKDLSAATGEVVLAQADASGASPEAAETEEVAEGEAAATEAETVAAGAEADPGGEAASVTVASADAASSEPSPIPARDGGYGLGREALPEEVAAWDIDIRPDGQGLPEGSGDVMAGEEVYLNYCSTCHGDFGEAVGRWPVLMGGDGTLAGADPVKTVGSYWPYLSTVYDYVHRAMPFGNAQSLTDDEVYAVTAYILYLNALVDDDFVLSRETFAEFALPNEDGFFPDDRAEAELASFSAEPCMSDCTDGDVEVTARAQVVDVTPEDEARRRAVEAEAAESEEQGSNLMESAAEIGTEAGADGAEDQATDTARTVPANEAAGEVPGAEVQEAAAVEPSDAPSDAAPDPELVAAGERLFRRCASCHKVGEGAKNATGPQLNGLLGRAVGGLEDYNYSSVFQAYHDEGRVWDDENLAAFIADPKGWAPGTKMSFRGLAKPEDQGAIVAYLRSVGE